MAIIGIPGRINCDFCGGPCDVVCAGRETYFNDRIYCLYYASRRSRDLVGGILSARCAVCGRALRRIDRIGVGYHAVYAVYLRYGGVSDVCHHTKPPRA